MILSERSVGAGGIARSAGRRPYTLPLALAPYAVLAIGLLGHAGAVLLSGGRSSGAFDLWGVPVLELAAGALAVFAGCRSASRRAVAWTAGSAIILWAAGDCLSTATRLGPVQFNPWAIGALHLGFYPLVLTALAVFLHAELRKSDLADGIDGLITGLGGAAACAAFTFQAFPAGLSGDAPGTLTHLGFLAGNTLLAAMLGGCLGAISGRRGLATILVAAGLFANLVAQTSGIFQGFAGVSGAGSALDSILVPSSMFLVSLALWMGDGVSDRKRDRRTEFVLPNAAAAAALAIEFVNTGVALNRAALLFASLTLLAAGFRLFLLLHETRAISEFRHEQAATDELTGLWNRRHLFRVLDTYFAKRAAGQDTPLAFLFVDLNRFKEINDSFGHPAGDQLLKLLASRLSGSLRDSDILVRLGGDEFAVVLPGSDTEGAVTVALRLSSCLDHPFQIDRVSAHIGASIGIAVAPQDASDSEGLLSCADVAMYRAKLDKTKLACYEHTIDVERDQMHLLEELRAGIAGDELLLHFQPQLDLRTGAVAGVEALLRWNHPRLGMLAPVNFLPLAERTGEIGAVTRWVLDHAARQLEVWRSRGLELTVSVNVSPTNLVQADLLTTVTDTLNRHGLPASTLVLEVTENWVTTEFETAKGVISALSDIGVAVSIDDFGAGTTSLAYLRELAARELKLDRAFVTGLTGNPDDREPELLRSTIELGHAMGLRIVAEGVEDETTLDLLTKFGCDLAQGYHIGKPKPAHELALRPKMVRAA